MNALVELLNLPENEKAIRGLIHTPAEIAQQPDTWRFTFELFQKKQRQVGEFLSSAGLSTAPVVFLVGAGTSGYIGHCLAILFRSLWRCEVIVIPSTDLLTHMDKLVLPGRKYLWISFSRSGDTPEGVAVLEAARRNRPDIHHIIISCNARGRMVRENARDPRILCTCLDDEVNDRGLAMTTSFSNMVVFAQCLAHADDLGAYERILLQLIRAGKSFLPTAADCAAGLAKGRYTKACFVGSGPLRAAAMESGLKLLELTAGRTFTMSESALGLRHGPMAALDQDTLFVCLLSDDEQVQKYERDLLDEIRNKRLVRTCVVVAGKRISGMDTVAEHFIAPAVPLEVADDYRPVVDVMFGQLLGLFLSLQWDLRPDSPSPTGVINRVVQNVTIYS